MRSWVFNLKVTFNSSVYLIPLKRRGLFSVLLSPCVLRVLICFLSPCKFFMDCKSFNGWNSHLSVDGSLIEMFTRELSPQPRLPSQTCYDAAPSKYFTCAPKLSFLHPTPICSFLFSSHLKKWHLFPLLVAKDPLLHRQMWPLPSFSFNPIVKNKF